jgi:DNA-binding NtrC family response regulator
MVLIVEDDPLARRALQSLFTTNGYNSRSVGSAEDALEACRHGPERPGMVLIDIDLPGMSGLQLLQKIQREFPGVSCTLMSANDHDLSPRDGGRAVPFFPKPLRWKQLLTLMRNVEALRAPTA